MHSFRKSRGNIKKQYIWTSNSLSINGVPLFPAKVIKLSFILWCLNENMGSIYGTDGLWNFTITIAFK